MTSWRFHKLMCDSRMKFTDYSVHCLVQILGKMGNWWRVLQLIDWIQRGEWYKSYNAKYMYTTVLSILGRAERAKQALEVFQAMREDFSSYPDMASYHVIAVILGRAGFIRELVDIMDSLRNGPDRDILTLPLKNWDPCLYPDVIVYNALINACVQQKEWKGAEWVLKKMYQDGTKPDIASYGLVMEAMMAAGKFDMVEYYFSKMQNLGSVPDVLTYKVIMQASCKEGKVDKAIQTVSDMENKGIVGTAGLYYELARGLCSLGRYNEALLQIDRIKKGGKKPIYVAYTGLIQASMDHGYLENAIYIFNHLQNVCVPNTYTLNLMLKLYADNDMFKDVKLLYQNIRSGTINPKVSPNGIDNTTVKADFNTFITVLKACAAAQDWDYFENVYWDMIFEGISPDNTSLIKLIMAACRAGKGQLLESVYVKLAQAGAAPHVSVYKELVFHNIASRNYLHACEYLHRMARQERLNTTKGEWIQFLNRSNYEIQKEHLQGLIETGQSCKAANETVARFDDFMNSFRILAEQYV